MSEIWPLAMKMRKLARREGHENLADTYLMIAAADLFETLKPNYLKLCSLLFLDIVLVHVGVCPSNHLDRLHKKRRKLRTVLLELI